MKAPEFSAYDFAKMVLKIEPNEYQKRILKALDSGEQIILSRRPSLRSTQMYYTLAELWKGKKCYIPMIGAQNTMRQVLDGSGWHLEEVEEDIYVLSKD